MKKDKSIICFYTISRILFFVLLIPMFLTITNVADNQFHGYDVDADGNLYIGRLHQIEVYNDGNLLHIIEIPKYRNWSFSLNNDSIILSNITSIYEMNTSGKIVSERPEVTNKLYSQMLKRKEVIGPDGTVFKRIAPFGWTQIMADDICVYRIPFQDYFLMLTLDFLVPIFFVLSAVFLLYHKKKNKTENEPTP